MRTQHPLKTRTFSFFLHPIRKNLAILSLSSLALCASTTSFASHRHGSAVLSPSPIPTETVQTTSQEIGGKWTWVLFIAALVLAGRVIQQRRNFAKMFEKYQRSIQNLRHDAEYAESITEDFKRKASEMEERMNKAITDASAKGMHLLNANRELEELWARVEAMLEVDPDIEQKAKELAEINAQAELEEEKCEEERRLQKLAEREGRDKLSDLLNQMKRGY